MKTAHLLIIAVAFAVVSVVAPVQAGERQLRADGSLVLAYSHNAEKKRLKRQQRMERQERKRQRRERKQKRRLNQGGHVAVIPPSVALRSALRYSPGSQGLGVRLLRKGRPVYAVKVKSGNRIMRILIDARTGRRVGN